jgi:hypothetical protein
MALSMDEQRILAEIERQLADDDPSLAVRLSTFGRPGLAAGLRTPRGKVLASFVALAVVALLSLMVYSLIPLRILPAHGSHLRSPAMPSQSAQTARASQPATTGTTGTTGAASKAPATGKAPAAGRILAAGKAPAGKGGGDTRTARTPASRQQARSG